MIWAVDITLLVLSLLMAQMIRLNRLFPAYWPMFWEALPVVLAVKLVVFYYFDLYHGMWRYTSITDLINVIKAATVSTLGIVFILLLSNRFMGFSRSIFVIDWLLTILLIAGSRVAIRFYFENAASRNSPGTLVEGIFGHLRRAPAEQGKLLIIGAGDAAEKIYREIRGNGRLQYRVIGFLDDNPAKRGKKIHGVPVLGAIHEIRWIAEKAGADEALIAIPSATGEEMRRIVGHCKESGIPFKTVPSMGELIDGRLTISAIRNVAYRDLLGRKVIRLDTETIGAYLLNQCVLVTGAGGSIGAELCRQICRFRPKTLVLFDRTENSLYSIDMELRENFRFIEVIPLLADIQDIRQIRMAFEKHRPQTVFHAAAYKHVPMLEQQPWQPVRNNVLGTKNLIDVARQFDTERFVFVSTDKAVRPANVMGASKRVAEMLVLNQYGCGHGLKTQFVSVRFGNVVGSDGSVVPLFKRQIENGGPVTVTHPDVTRYFMTIPEACQLILQAGGMGQGGEIFVLDMGQPVRIVDMAQDLIRLSGFEPEKDIRIKYIGLRPGEKLYEELITEEEGILPTAHEKIMVLKGRTCALDPLLEKINELVRAADCQDADRIRQLFSEVIPDYRPATGR